MEPIRISSTLESDTRSLRTSRPETTMFRGPQAPSQGHGNSDQPSDVVLPAAVDMVIPPSDDRPFMALDESFLGACLECSMMCKRAHGAKSENFNGRSLRSPCFYKVVTEYCVEGGPSCWMQVPSEFVRKYLQHLDCKRNNLVLENADGKPWPVVYLAGHEIFFTGWGEFSTANNLAIGDMLFFSFVEQAKFVAHVFDKSGCEKRVPAEMPETNPPRRKTTHSATQTHFVTPAPSPASKSFGPGFTRLSRPDAEIGKCNKSRAEWDGFRTPAALSRDGTHEPDDDNTTPQTFLPTPDWRSMTFMRSKGRPSISETYKFQSQSAPAPRNNVPTTSWHDKAGPSTMCSNLKLSQQGNPRGKKKSPIWGETWSQIQARALVTKARLRKMNIAPLPMSKHRGIFNSNRNSPKKRSFVKSLESDSEIGFDAGSAYDGERRQCKRDRRSLSKDGAFVSSLDSLRLQDEGIEEAAADLQAFAGYGMNSTNGRFQGGPSRHREMADSFDDIPVYIPKYVPEYLPEYVQLPRKPGRPRKYPPPTITQQKRHTLPESSDGDQAMVVREKRRRGRPFKHQVPGSSDINVKPPREIFVSRRRKVTQAEREEALNAAFAYASHLKASTTFVVVMRQSFVYRNFVLGVPRRFAARYMPNCNREVALVDDAWNAWYCSWNASYKYMSGRGWRNFALEHCIEEDDALLMEILEESEIALTIKVHIFRVVAIPNGLSGWQSHVCPPNSYCEQNSGVPIEPMLQPPGKIQPRLRRRVYLNQASGKRVKREPDYSEDSISSDSSEELD